MCSAKSFHDEIINTIHLDAEFIEGKSGRMQAVMEDGSVIDIDPSELRCSMKCQGMLVVVELPNFFHETEQ